MLKKKTWFLTKTKLFLAGVIVDEISKEDGMGMVEVLLIMVEDEKEINITIKSQTTHRISHKIIALKTILKSQRILKKNGEIRLRKLCAKYAAN